MQRVKIRADMLIAIAAELLPRDRPLSAKDYRIALGTVIELKDAYEHLLNPPQRHRPPRWFSFWPIERK
jgi:hypothetical protein